MTNVSSIARDGLQAATLRLEVSAHNTANLQTDGFQPHGVEATARAGGGVQAVEVVPRDVAADARVDGVIVASGTDVVEETVARTLASASFRANLATLRADQENQDALFSIRR